MTCARSANKLWGFIAETEFAAWLYPKDALAAQALCCGLATLEREGRIVRSDSRWPTIQNELCFRRA
jgi:hypothetical protein